MRGIVNRKKIALGGGCLLLVILLTAAAFLYFKHQNPAAKMAIFDAETPILVWNGDQKGYINPQGEFIVPLQSISSATDFFGAHAIVTNESINENGESVSKSKLINRQGEVVKEANNITLHQKYNRYIIDNELYDLELNKLTDGGVVSGFQYGFMNYETEIDGVKHFSIINIDGEEVKSCGKADNEHQKHRGCGLQTSEPINETVAVYGVATVANEGVPTYSTALINLTSKNTIRDHVGNFVRALPQDSLLITDATVSKAEIYQHIINDEIFEKQIWVSSLFQNPTVVDPINHIIKVEHNETKYYNIVSGEEVAFEGASIDQYYRLRTGYHIFPCKTGSIERYGVKKDEEVVYPCENTVVNYVFDEAFFNYILEKTGRAIFEVGSSTSRQLVDAASGDILLDNARTNFKRDGNSPLIYAIKQGDNNEYELSAYDVSLGKTIGPFNIGKISNIDMRGVNYFTTTTDNRATWYNFQGEIIFQEDEKGSENEQEQ
jgi:hypothetical protein